MGRQAGFGRGRDFLGSAADSQPTRGRGGWAGRRRLRCTTGRPGGSCSDMVRVVAVTAGQSPTAVASLAHFDAGGSPEVSAAVWTARRPAAEKARAGFSWRRGWRCPGRRRCRPCALRRWRGCRTTAGGRRRTRRPGSRGPKDRRCGSGRRSRRPRRGSGAGREPGRSRGAGGGWLRGLGG